MKGGFEQMLALVLLGFTLTVVAGGAVFLEYQKRQSEADAQTQLAAVADLKAAELNRWRHERLDDGELIRGNLLTVVAVKRFLANPADAFTRNQLSLLLENFQTHVHYKQAALLNAQEEPSLATSPPQGWITEKNLAWARASAQAGPVALSDLALSDGGSIDMKVVIPLLDQTQPQSAPVMGAFLLEIDPGDFLFPQIQTWPTSSPTAETRLVRKDGDDVVYLNTLRHQSNTALRLRLKITDSPDLPAANAIRGKTGLVRGLDYRRIPVIAVARRIPDSPWFIIAKEDLAEIRAPIRQWAWIIAVGSILAIVAASLGVTLIWRYREAQFARQELAERRHSETILGRKNAELEHLIYAASHDLRSPLVNIEGFSRRLEKTCNELSAALEKSSDPAGRQAVELSRVQIPKSINYIRAGVSKMNALISGLLQLSRLGQASLRPHILDMNRMMQQLTTSMAYQIQKAGATIQYDALPACTGDPLLINQVFSNLLDNALKYRDPARPLVIRITGKTEAGQKIYCVSDTGLGIPSGSLTKVWELFHRLNPSGPQGEGLGLNLVRRILDRHDGRAWVDSTSGEGSRFYVSLPDPHEPDSPSPFDKEPLT